ncbi:DNA cytosine methyltransferase [Halobacillus sp. B29]|uniref:DNA cytosine methyltransferase n=1 Tax=Halobacillus sp. B29 TaxID=3457432 RepID=UPI003FCE89D5
MVSNIQDALSNVQIPLQVASLFSGAGIMDQGFKESGYDIQYAVEMDRSIKEILCFSFFSQVVLQSIGTKNIIKGNEQ